MKGAVKSEAKIKVLIFVCIEVHKVGKPESMISHLKCFKNVSLAFSRIALSNSGNK
jgi:hypothetical protein